MLKVRAVTEADVLEICSFAKSADELYFFFPKASFPLTPDQLAASISQRSDSNIVEDNGQVVGFANFYHWGLQSTCSIGNVVVSPHARNRGIAKFLMQHMVSLAYTKYEASEITVSCFNSNTVGLLLYPKLGFNPYEIEERKDQNGNRVALVHMRHYKSQP